jgi:geranylgeranyl pyrophosphate synthase
VGLGLRVALVPEGEQAPWRAFGAELGLLFQVVDDILDGDGYAALVGREAARQRARNVAERARHLLDAVPGDASVLVGLVEALTFRTG